MQLNNPEVFVPTLNNYALKELFKKVRTNAPSFKVDCLLTLESFPQTRLEDFNRDVFNLLIAYVDEFKNTLQHRETKLQDFILSEWQPMLCGCIGIPSFHMKFAALGCQCKRASTLSKYRYLLYNHFKRKQNETMA